MNLLLENLPEGNSFVTVQTVVYAALLGLAAGLLISTYSKLYLGRIVRALIKKEAVGKESAVSFVELGIRPSRLLTYSLRDHSALRKHVCIKNPEECALPDNSRPFVKKLRKFFSGSEEREKRYDLKRAVLYVPEDRKHEAELKYETKGNPVITVIFAALVFATLALLAVFGLPKILEMLDKVVASFKNL